MAQAELGATPAVDPEPALTESAAESPAQLLWLAFAWLLAVVLSGIPVAFVTFVATRVYSAVALARGSEALTLDPSVRGLLFIVGLDLMMLLAVRRRAKIVGQGDRIAGVGGGPIRRPAMLIALSTLGLVGVLVWSVTLSRWLPPPQPFAKLVSRVHTTGGMLQFASLAILVGLVPLSEELFFRGWLWTGLRKHWGVLPVMLATTLPWLLIHMPDGLTRPLFLLPSAILFNLARHLCGGVRASIVVHVLNNLMALGLPMLVLWLGNS